MVASASTNLLVGSRAGAIYIARCVPAERTITVKTTIDAGTFPEYCIVDLVNKSFYCLDSCPDQRTGRLLTLAPTELGTVEEQAFIDTGGPQPFYMISIEQYIYVLNRDSYSIFKMPKPSRSSRRRRRSSLAVVREDTVAESLDELYKISRSMDVDKSTSDPASALDSLRSSMQSETETEVIEIRHVIEYKGPPMVKLLPLPDSRFVLGLTQSTIKTFRITDNGTLSALDSMPVEYGIDCDVCGEIYVLTPNKLYEFQATEGQLEKSKEYNVDAQSAHSLVVKNDCAYIACVSEVVSLDLRTSRTTVLNIPSTTFTTSRDGHSLFASVRGEASGSLSMYNKGGDCLGSCELKSPVGIYQMS